MDNNSNEVKDGVVADAEKCINLSGDALGSNQHEAVDIVLSDVSNKNTNISLHSENTDIVTDLET
ncbi:unnamed protein product, partial [Rotaria magnacalcarata]